MVKYIAALGAAVAVQGAAAKTRFVASTQLPPPDACHPQGDVTWDTTWAPCLSQGEVEGQCAPPSPDVAGWTFQRDCMCKGSFFEDAIGCGKCKKANALQGTKETSQWDNIFTSIKAKYCTDAPPVSSFGGYWESALSTHGRPVPIAGDERKRSVAAGDVKVENYYRAEKPQGPGLPCPSAASPKPNSNEAEPVKNGTQRVPAVQSSSVVLHAAATARVAVAVVTGVPAAPVSPKFAANVTAQAKAETVVTYGLSSIDCAASFVDGVVVSSCGAMKMIAGSDAMVPPEARKGAVDMSRCVCAIEFLAPKKLTPAPEAVVSASVSVNVSAVINIFSPADCEGPCSAPPSNAPVQPKKDCVDCAPEEEKVPASPAQDEPEEKEAPAVAPKPKDAAVPSNPADEAGVTPAGPAANGVVAPPSNAPVQPKKDCVDCAPEEEKVPAAPAQDEPEEKEAPAVALKPKDAAVPSNPADEAGVTPAGPAANGVVAPPAKPAATGAISPAPVNPSARPVTAGAASAYGSAAVMAVAFAVFAL